MKKNKRAFTLAEVLIALTIIGVVAALTIPTLVQKTNKQEYVSALQKAYSTLSQATQLIIAEEGSPQSDENSTGWAADRNKMYELYLKHLHTAKECGSASGCFLGGNAKFLTGGSYNFNEHGGMRKFVFADGMQAAVDNWNTGACNFDNNWGYGSKDVCGWFDIDINGAKKPNTVGRDIFLLVIKKDGLYPAGCDYDNLCVKEDGSLGDGRACACKVIREGKMDY